MCEQKTETYRHTEERLGKNRYRRKMRQDGDRECMNAVTIKEHPGRGKEGSFLKISRRSTALQTP